jgi:chaperonin GroEL (HSP60 family)
MTSLLICLQELKRWMTLMANTALRTKHVALWRDLLARLAVDSMLQVTRAKSRGVRLAQDVTLLRVSELDITCSFWTAGIVFRGYLKVTPRKQSISDAPAPARDWQRSACQTELCACLIADDLTFQETAVKSSVSSVSMLTRVYNDTQETEYWQRVTDTIAKLGITLVLVSGEISPRGRAVLEARDCMAIERVPSESLLRIAGVTRVKVTTARCLPHITERHVTKVSNLNLYNNKTQQSEQLFEVPHTSHASIVLW